MSFETEKLRFVVKVKTESAERSGGTRKPKPKRAFQRWDSVACRGVHCLATALVNQKKRRRKVKKDIRWIPEPSLPVVESGNRDFDQSIACLIERPRRVFLKRNIRVVPMCIVST